MANETDVTSNPKVIGEKTLPVKNLRSLASEILYRTFQDLDAFQVAEAYEKQKRVKLFNVELLSCLCKCRIHAVCPSINIDNLLKSQLLSNKWKIDNLY